MAAKKERETIKIKKYETTSQFITSNGDLDIIKVLEKFQELMKEEYRNETGEFVEREGRLIFLAFIKPIINGAGFYYVEPQTRTNKRMDIVVAYNKKEYIIELKKWYGKAGEDKGFKQLADYMNIKNSNESYMIVFNFRKRKRYIKEWKVIDGKRIFEVVV